MNDNIIYLLLIILIPIVPAFIFFKFLPNRADISGPFKGLQIKLAGAFGGYFLIFIVLIAMIKPLLINPTVKENLDFQIIGRAVYNKDPRRNVVVIANRFCGDSLISSKKRKTDNNGSFTFDFENLSKNERIQLVWEDPTGNPIFREFTPTRAVNDIVLEN